MVLFHLLQVPYAAFIPSHLLCTFVVGRASALVVDVGYKETTILPVSLKFSKHVVRGQSALLLKPSQCVCHVIGQDDCC